jgi:hypothetical protein
VSAPRLWWLAALGLPASLLVLLALTHAPGARPSSRCPLSISAVRSASPERLETLRAAAMAPLRRPRPSPARPALGFVLQQTARADVASWASGKGARCEEELGGALRCQGFDLGEGEARVRDLYASFDAEGRLVAFDVLREGLADEAAAQGFAALLDRLARVLGPPSASWGEPSASYLGAAPLRQAAARFRFVDYAADISVTNHGEKGGILREQYRSIPAQDGRP